MAKWTIAQLRAREVERLAKMKTDDPTEADYAEARRLMNSYYRLCGLSDTNLYLANDSRRYDAKRLERSEERETAWYKRLSKEFHEFCGLRLNYFGHFPSIVDDTYHHCVSVYFYR